MGTQVEAIIKALSKGATLTQRSYTVPHRWGTGYLTMPNGDVVEVHHFTLKRLASLLTVEQINEPMYSTKTYKVPEVK